MTQYVYTAIDDPLGVSTTAYDINNSGQIVGSYTDSNNIVHAFLYSGGTYVTIDDPLATGGAIAYGINDAGQIVGGFTDGAGSHGFLYSGGVYTTLDAPDAYGFTGARGINNAGVIVGNYTWNGFFGSHTESFSYSAGTFVDSFSIYGGSVSGINDANQGVYSSNNSPPHGQSASYIGQVLAIDPYASQANRVFPYGLETDTTHAAGINNAGQGVGYYYDTAFHVHGFFYSGGQYTTIDDPTAIGRTEAFGLNDNGQIVGSADGHGFLATPVTTIAAPLVNSLFNSDNDADILWQNDNGTAGVWLMSSDGVTPMQEVGVGTNPGAAWHIVAIGDTNGDRHSDILWQNDNGTAGVWIMSADGFTPAEEVGVGTNPGPNFHVKAAADFNGDGYADILWQDDAGQAGVWLMGSNGVTPANERSVGTNPGAAWHIKAAADFDGDGHADILWQNDNGTAGVWLMSANGFTPKAEPGIGTNPGADWHIKAAADFDGDGHADILWQNDNGTAGIWLMSADGFTPRVEAGVGTNPGPNFHIVGAADYNGDGHADILWQDDNGQAGVWLMGADGVTPATEMAVGDNPGSSWHIVGLVA